jgi:excisionase family DNA binding protein
VKGGTQAMENKLDGRETPWMTIEETAEYLRCSLRFLREKAANKEIPHTKFGGKALFHVQRIDEWLLSTEEGQDQDNGGNEKIPDESFNEATKIRPDADREKANELVNELIDFNERFVTGLGNNLAKDFELFDFRKLSEKVYAQLSRWCHPNRNSEREKKAKPIVHELSTELFGHVISRTKHPSYSG